MAEWVRTLAWTGDRTVPAGVRIPLRKTMLRNFGISVYPVLPVSFGGDTKSRRSLLSGVYRPLSRRMDRCDRVIQNESRDPFGGNVYYVTMQIKFLTHKLRNVECNLHCDVQ